MNRVLYALIILFAFAAFDTIIYAYISGIFVLIWLSTVIWSWIARMFETVRLSEFLIFRNDLIPPIDAPPEATFTPETGKPVIPPWELPDCGVDPVEKHYQERLDTFPEHYRTAHNWQEEQDRIKNDSLLGDQSYQLDSQKHTFDAQGNIVWRPGQRRIPPTDTDAGESGVPAPPPHFSKEETPQVDNGQPPRQPPLQQPGEQGPS